MTRSAVLVVGSCAAPDAGDYYAGLLDRSSYIVAADGGLAVCRDAGRLPDACVGDMDSVDPTLLESAAASGVLIVRVPREKDASDLDLAVDLARGRGASSLTVTAAFGGRLDHTLAALGTLASNADLGAVGRDPGLEIHALDAASRPAVDLQRVPGSVLSVFAIEQGTVLSIAGVRYPLHATLLDTLSSFGLSNVALEPRQRVEVLSGRAVIVCDDRPASSGGLQNL